VARALEQLGPPQGLLVAVSGGADSVALLHLLVQARRRRRLAHVALTVGHVDHRLRVDSAEDARLVQEAAQALELPFDQRIVRLASRASLEAAARSLRYGALSEMAQAHGCEAIVTAHTATDQAETLLWRLARGAGGRGLAAMAPDRPLGALRLLRPLLGVTREELRRWAMASGLRWRDDPSNEDDRPRARLRAEVLPVLERLAPGAVQRIVEAAARLREDEQLLNGLVPPLDDPPEVASLAGLPGPVRRRALAAWCDRVLPRPEGHPVPGRVLEALDRLVLTASGEVALPGGRSAADRPVAVVAVVAQGRLRMEMRPRRPPPKAPLLPS